MSKIIQILIIFLLIPSLLEAVDGNIFLINIPGSPLSVGRITFILSGVIALIGGKNLFLKNNILFAFILILSGFLTGGLLSNDIAGNLSKTIAQSLILIGICGISKIWKLKYFQYLLDAFFLFVFIYWAYYIMSHTFKDGKFLAYSILYWNDEVVNHHIPGLNISISSVYLATRFFIRTRYFKILSWTLLFFSILLCLVIESRSNFLFTALSALVILIVSQKNMAKIALVIIPIIFAGSIALISYVSQYDSIVRRFDVQDTEYQAKSNDSRVQLITLAYENFLTNPLGNGVENIKLRYDIYRNFLTHNQYLSFIVAGGLVTILGVFLWLFTLSKLLLKIFDRKRFNSYNIYVSAIGVLLFTFHITILTIDSTGLMFFIIISLLIYCTNEVLYTRMPNQKITVSFTQPSL